MAGRENAATKGRRLLVEGRVRLLHVDEDAGHVTAEVRGDSGCVYTVSYDAGGWSCDCPTLGVCSHIRACQLVVVMEPRS